MSYVLDTDIASAYLRGNRSVFNRFIQHSGGLYVSAVTIFELYVWALRAKTSPTRMQSLTDFLSHTPIINVDHDIAHRAGEIQAGLLDRGLPMPDIDLLIASTALHNNFTLVTHNLKDYQNVPDLRIEDWLST